MKSSVDSAATSAHADNTGRLYLFHCNAAGHAGRVHVFTPRDWRVTPSCKEEFRVTNHSDTTNAAALYAVTHSSALIAR